MCPLCRKRLPTAEEVPSHALEGRHDWYRYLCKKIKETKTCIVPCKYCTYSLYLSKVVHCHIGDIIYTEAELSIKCGLMLRSIERRPKVQFSMGHKFTLHLLHRYDVKLTVKGTQEREFFWLWFWILYLFIVSYANILRFWKTSFLIGPLWGGATIVPRSLKTKQNKKMF